VLAAGHLLHVGMDGGWTSVSAEAGRLIVVNDPGHVRVATPVVVATLLSVLLFLMTPAWLLSTSVIGFVRLVAARTA
jgi:hypothetical protein